MSVEINPFLVWLAGAKVAKYSKASLEEARQTVGRLGRLIRTGSGPLAASPRIANLDRWWPPEQLEHLRRLKGALAGLSVGRHARDLVLVAFCRVIIGSANVTRRHQSLSFEDDRQLALSLDLEDYALDVASLVESVLPNPKGRARVLLGDARELRKVEAGSIDLVITSPPYPNRLTAVRELRPYMYWLDFLHEPSDAGEMDWKAIGGTWGAATHRLARWTPTDGVYVPRVIRSVCERIQKEKSKSAGLLSNYVRRYFADIVTHIEEVRRVVRKGGRVHYVVGNSSFYGHIVETEKAYIDIFRKCGFRQPEAYALRKRSSKAELYEYVVSAERA